MKPLNPSGAIGGGARRRKLARGAAAPRAMEGWPPPEREGGAEK